MAVADLLEPSSSWAPPPPTEPLQRRYERLKMEVAVTPGLTTDCPLWSMPC